MGFAFSKNGAEVRSGLGVGVSDSVESITVGCVVDAPPISIDSVALLASRSGEFEATMSDMSETDVSGVSSSQGCDSLISSSRESGCDSCDGKQSGSDSENDRVRVGVIRKSSCE